MLTEKLDITYMFSFKFHWLLMILWHITDHWASSELAVENKWNLTALRVVSCQENCKSLLMGHWEISAMHVCHLMSLQLMFCQNLLPWLAALLAPGHWEIGYVKPNNVFICDEWIYIHMIYAWLAGQAACHWSYLSYPPHNEVVVGYIGFTPSICLSMSIHQSLLHSVYTLWCPQFLMDSFHIRHKWSLAICNKTAEICRILLCPLYSMYSYG